MRRVLLHDKTVTSLDELRQVLLTNRGIASDQETEFFQPTNPLALELSAVGFDEKKVVHAVQLIKEYKAQQILIFGDYDADGICATAVMWLTLNALGYQAKPFIPHRTQHGYGISHKALDEILADSVPDLVISVDNGIVAHEPVQRLLAAGAQVIITDHHQPEEILPPASEIVHTTQLCGTTVSWMLAREVLRAHHQQAKADTIAEGLLDLCGIATIADQVPLLKANRSFAKFGVTALQNSQRPGIKALCLAAETTPAEITADSVNYVLAPRINAMGRLDHGLDALRLLCTGKVDSAAKLASTLQNTNIRRQGLTDAMLKDAELQAELYKDEHLILVASPNYHEGVIGLIAGRLTEKYSKPAIAISMGELHSKASARSIEGINVVELIRQVREDLLEVGGHPMAAGFGLVTEKIELVRTRLYELAKMQITTEALVPTLKVDCALDFSLVTMKLANVLQEFEPFGPRNPKPLIELKNISVVDMQTIGKNSQHIKLQITDQNQENFVTALGWNMSQSMPTQSHLKQCDMYATVEVNTWKNRSNLQLIIKDLTFEEVSA